VIEYVTQKHGRRIEALDALAKHSKGLAGFSGCLASEISQSLMRDDEAGPSSR
jgi:hypothetical protein